VKSTTAPPLKGLTTASPWVPLWRIIERIASALGDSREPEHYARTRLYIRQAALDGQLRIRGRHEIDNAGQDQTKFSDVYTEIPQAYWKHSVINALTTGATFEADGHTNPETVYAWGPKGVYETNSYAGLQINPDDVSQLIGDVSGIGFSAHKAMPEKEEWISAASALSLLGMKDWFSSTRTICKRAHAGLIQARAERFIHDSKFADHVDIPIEFWWAEGEAALNQNWTTGDFDTWVGRGIDAIHLQAFGVTFRRSDIERFKPPPLVENATSQVSTTALLPSAIIRSDPAPGDLGTTFISYSRDSALHEEKVLSLSDKLRSEGIDCVLDQYESSPPEGWPKWMDREIIMLQEMVAWQPPSGGSRPVSISSRPSE
jgi:SEFIR domain